MMLRQQEASSAEPIDAKGIFVDIAFRSTPWAQEAAEQGSSDTTARILFVSESNVCRSVLAEAIMRRLLQERGLAQEVSLRVQGHPVRAHSAVYSLLAFTASGSAVWACMLLLQHHRQACDREWRACMHAVAPASCRAAVWVPSEVHTRKGVPHQGLKLPTRRSCGGCVQSRRSKMGSNSRQKQVYVHACFCSTSQGRLDFEGGNQRGYHGG